MESGTWRLCVFIPFFFLRQSGFVSELTDRGERVGSVEGGKKKKNQKEGKWKG